MILHNNPTALIVQGNTLANPKFKDGDSAQDLRLRRRQSAVLRQALEHRPRPAQRPVRALQAFGVPPAKQGDYAYLLHIVRSLKSTGKGACILPHGVLFRGNAEADIRRNLVRKGYIKGIIGLPANLFYGTGIPACIVVDRQGERPRPQGHLHDRCQPGLHEGRPQEPPARAGHPQDRGRLHPAGRRSRATRAWSPSTRSKKNDYNLNMPRYIDSQTPEDLQDIDAHLQGRHPRRRCRCARALLGCLPASCGKTLFKANRPGYFDLAVEKPAIKPTIYEHPEFTAFIAGMNAHFAAWRQTSAATLKALKAGCHPKEVIADAGRGAAGPLPRQAADRSVRRLPAPDGLLGRDDAGRLLPDRRRRLEGRDLSRHREEQARGKDRRIRAGHATWSPSRSSSPDTSPRNRPPSTN